jgi:nicotinamide mononucleotide adenylyltransferase
MEKPGKPYDHPRIFWDVDVNKIDFEAKANFVIERVFERGDVQDIRNCRRYYGDEKVTEALLNAKFLPERRLHLASAVINKPLNEFRCYILRQSNPALYPY